MDQKKLFGTTPGTQADDAAAAASHKYASSFQQGPCWNTSSLSIRDYSYEYLKKNTRHLYSLLKNIFLKEHFRNPTLKVGIKTPGKYFNKNLKP